MGEILKQAKMTLANFYNRYFLLLIIISRESPDSLPEVMNQVSLKLYCQ